MSNRGLLVVFSLGVVAVASNSFAQSPELLSAVRAHDAKALDRAQAELAACTATKKPCARWPNLSLLTGLLELSAGDATAALKQLSGVPAPKGLQAFHGWYLAEAQAYASQKAAAVKTLTRVRSQLKAPASVATSADGGVELASAGSAQGQWLNERVMPRLGELLIETGKPREALKILVPLTTRSMSPELLLARAQAYQAVNDTKNATADYQTLAMRYPTHPHGAIARAQLGPDALEHWSQDDQLTRILALQSAGAITETLAAIEAFGEPSGRFASANKARLALVKGQILLSKGKDDEAFKELDFAAATGTAQVAADALNARARRLMRLGQNAEAQKFFRQLEKRFPSDQNADDAGYYASWLNMSSGDDAAAATQFAQFELDHPSSRKRDEARWFRAYALFRTRQYSRAREVLQSLAQDFQRSTLVPQALYWATRSAQMQSLSDAGTSADAGPRVDVVAEYKAVISGFPGSIYAWLARERLRELKVEVGPLFPPLSGAPAPTVTLPAELSLASTLAGTGLFRDAAEETSRVLSLATAETAVTWGQALQSLGDYGSAHTLAARFLWSQVYCTKQIDALRLMYPEAYATSVRHWAGENGVSPYFAWAIMRRESAFRPEVSSSADARGLMQIIPPTAKEISREMKIETVHADALFAPETNVQLGTWYLSALLTRMGHMATASASYNAGPSAVSKWVKARGDLQIDQFIEEIPYKETRGYVKQVVADALIYAELYGDQAAPALSMSVTPVKVEGVQF